MLNKTCVEIFRKQRNIVVSSTRAHFTLFLSLRSVCTYQLSARFVFSCALYLQSIIYQRRCVRSYNQIHYVFPLGIRQPSISTDLNFWVQYLKLCNKNYKNFNTYYSYDSTIDIEIRMLYIINLIDHLRHEVYAYKRRYNKYTRALSLST